MPCDTDTSFFFCGCKGHTGINCAYSSVYFRGRPCYANLGISPWGLLDNICEMSCPQLRASCTSEDFLRGARHGDRPTHCGVDNCSRIAWPTVRGAVDGACRARHNSEEGWCHRAGVWCSLELSRWCQWVANSYHHDRGSVTVRLIEAGRADDILPTRGDQGDAGNFFHITLPSFTLHDHHSSPPQGSRASSKARGLWEPCTTVIRGIIISFVYHFYGEIHIHTYILVDLFYRHVFNNHSFFIVVARYMYMTFDTYMHIYIWIHWFWFHGIVHLDMYILYCSHMFMLWMLYANMDVYLH